MSFIGVPPGQRPNPIDHYSTTEIRSLRRPLPRQITLVDDIVTRGSSFVGGFPHIEAAYPDAVIRCFALVRTISSGEIEAILDPVRGKITYQQDRLSRAP